MNLTTAENTEVFILEYYDDVLKTTIEQVNLAEHIMMSAEETTSPRGVENKLHVREVSEQCECYDTDTEVYKKGCPTCGGYGEVIKHQVCEWGPSGHGLHRFEIFDTKEEANEEIFRCVYEYYFFKDDQRDISYYDTEEEAREYLISYICDCLNVDEVVAVSLIKWNEKKQDIIDNREAKRYAQIKKEMDIDDKIAETYSTLIDPIEGETYKETAARFSDALGERIKGRVFHSAVKKIRKRL